MTNVLLIGLFFIALSGIVNLIEIRKFVRAFALLNLCSTTVKDKCKYPFRLFRIAFLLSPIGLDILIIGTGTTVGLGNGPTGFIIGLAGSCVITLGIKFLYWWFGRVKPQSRNFEVEYSKLLHNQ